MKTRLTWHKTLHNDDSDRLNKETGFKGCRKMSFCYSVAVQYWDAL
ncbi:hypothetical protein BN1184_AY_00420 [Pantoea ananatis]|nr:hypothetical protein BN1182_BF_00250 [Pantoea ananatis]CRH38345.1 hypothetical protein BN1184_AY_00420 [Pantoea ananatis]